MFFKNYYILLVGIAITSNALAQDATIVDDYKMVIKRIPYQVQICKDITTGGDKTGDTLKGAIIGGIIGNNVGDAKNNGALGAIIGGMLGHSNSNASNDTKTICGNETRYREQTEHVYDSSKITFRYEGHTYTLRFKKKRYSNE